MSAGNTTCDWFLLIQTMLSLIFRAVVYEVLMAEISPWKLMELEEDKYTEKRERCTHS